MIRLVNHGKTIKSEWNFFYQPIFDFSPLAKMSELLTEWQMEVYRLYKYVDSGRWNSTYTLLNVKVKGENNGVHFWWVGISVNFNLIHSVNITFIYNIFCSTLSTVCHYYFWSTQFLLVTLHSSIIINLTYIKKCILYYGLYMQECQVFLLAETRYSPNPL